MVFCPSYRKNLTSEVIFTYQTAAQCEAVSHPYQLDNGSLLCTLSTSNASVSKLQLQMSKERHGRYEVQRSTGSLFCQILQLRVCFEGAREGLGCGYRS